MAVFCLPDELIGFYKKNIEYVTVHAVDPDKRRYEIEGEAPKHYIDIDHYNSKDPFEIMPKRWTDAVVTYSKDTLLAYGILPWNITWQLRYLTDAFKSKNKAKILKYSADLGHYVADAHVPLHCTENYNGQMTGQKGIHAFWESRIPEMLADSFNYFIGKAYYINDPLDEAWKIIQESFSKKDSVLSLEKVLNKKFPQDKKYAYEQRGQSTVKTYSKEYTIAYNRLLHNMVERCMRKAILKVACFWYTAWVNAGKPDLMSLENEKIESTDKIELVKDNTNIKTREHEH